MPELQLPQKLRLFVAIAVPGEVKAFIQEAQDELRRALGAAQIRWTTPDQFHLTLRFLGSVDASSLQALNTALAAACRRYPPLELRAETIGFFPTARSPRVVWVGISDRGDGLARLHPAIQEATAPFTTEAPEKRFSGHITLGRVKGIRPSEVALLADAAAKLCSRSFGQWLEREVHLVRSELGPKGSRYTILQSFSLEAPLQT